MFWLMFLTACCAGAAAVLRGALSIYMQDAVSYSVETDYLQWDTPFPAVTICQFAGSEKTWKEAMKRNNIPNSWYTFAKSVTYWSKVCTSCNPSICLPKNSCTNEVESLVQKIRLDCKGVLKTCWWNDEEFSCCDRFIPIKTQYGTCFVFNSRQNGNEAIEYVNRITGLPVLTFTATEYISVKVHSPDEIITVASDNNMGQCASLPTVSDFEVIVNVQQTISETSVRGITQSSRDCLFLDERPESPDPWPFPRYSYSACVWYCKAKAQADICNCTHHFMPRVENLPVCDVKGLQCMHKNKDSFDRDVCDCPLDCEEMTTKVIHVSCNRINDAEAQVRGTRGTIRLGNLPSLRFRRHAIRDMLGLVVDFGGVVGVFLGASILSFIEIVYIFCIRKSH